MPLTREMKRLCRTDHFSKAAYCHGTERTPLYKLRAIVLPERETWKSKVELAGVVPGSKKGMGWAWQSGSWARSLMPALAT